MKVKFCANECSILALVVVVVLSLGTSTCSEIVHGTTLRRSSFVVHNESSMSQEKVETGEELGRELYPMGSSLPDCSHACGVCSPCKRVMVSFSCASESCPVIYRCLCDGKYYHVPSSK